MNRTDIAALAEGLVPFVREVVADGTAPLAARLGELEARPAEQGPAGEKGDKGDKGEPGIGLDGKDGKDGRDGAPGDIGLAPVEIASQIAGAVRMLAEAPPIVRDVKAISEPVVVVQRGEAGPRGLPGLPGVGEKGEKGDKGDPGPRGRDGTGIAGAAISRDGDLLLTLTDGVILTLALDKVTDNA